MFMKMRRGKLFRSSQVAVILCAAVMAAAAVYLHIRAEYMTLKHALRKKNIPLEMADLKKLIASRPNSCADKIDFIDFAENNLSRHDAGDRFFGNISGEALEEYIRTNSGLREKLSGIYQRREIFYIPNELDTDVVPEKLAASITGF